MFTRKSPTRTGSEEFQDTVTASRPINGTTLVRRPSIPSAGMVGSSSTFQGGFSSGGFDSRPNEPTRLPSARSPARSPDRSPERSPEFVPERFSPERSPDQGMPERRFERTTNDRPTDRLPERTDRTSRGLDESEMRSLPRIRAASPSSPAGGATSPRAHGSPALGFAADSSRLPPPPLSAATAEGPADDGARTSGRRESDGAGRAGEVYPVYKDRISFMISRGRSQPPPPPPPPLAHYNPAHCTHPQ